MLIQLTQFVNDGFAPIIVNVNYIQHFQEHDELTEIYIPGLEVIFVKESMIEITEQMRQAVAVDAIRN